VGYARAATFPRSSGRSQIRLLSGERVRDFVLSYQQEKLYLDMAPQPLHDVAVMILNIGLRIGEALALGWKDVHL
jgi:integrase